MGAFDREKLLIGEKNLEKLKRASVAVFGVGGVGGFTVEALARSGVGNIAVFDGDCVSESNINRQIIATENAVGKPKTEVIKERLLSINKDVKINAFNVFFSPDNADEYDLSIYDYIVDAVDTVTAKLEIISRAKSGNVPVISCMGTGGKLYPELLTVKDIKDTSVCPLARVMRRELKARGIEDLKVVYSTETAVKGKEKEIPSMIFVPATAGLILAREVVKDLIK